MADLTEKVSSLLGKRDKCSGCGACASVCPVGAITLEKDPFGFFYPHCDQSKCINCGACAKSCSYLTPPLTKRDSLRYYAAQSLNLEATKTSSSGSLFPLIAEHYLADGGVVYAATMTPDLQVRHEALTNVNDIQRFCGSKYVQSDLNGAYRSIKEDLIQGKKVCFFGTPCQVNGLCLVLQTWGVDSSRLLTCSLACHGVPSQALFDQYIGESEKTFNQKIISYHFRDKASGWQSASISFAFADGSKSLCPASQDPCQFAFQNNLSLRNSCFACASKKNNLADLLLGDCWGYEGKAITDTTHGVSLLIPLTAKGRDEVSYLSKQATLEEIATPNPQDKNPTLFSSTPKPSNRDSFLEGCLKNGFLPTAKSFQPTKKQRASWRQLWPSFICSLAKKRHKKRNVCIVTITDIDNYGNRLQNFALQEFLRTHFSVSVKTLWPNTIVSFHDLLAYGRYTMLPRFKMVLFKRFSIETRRYLAFRRMNRRVKKVHVIFHFPSRFAWLNAKFDYFVSGSDQVWNFDFPMPCFINNLEFALPRKRLSYAASFGKAQLDLGSRELFNHDFPNFSLLSFRESGALNTVQDLYRGPTTVNPDPVFLIPSNQWRRMLHLSSKKPHLAKGPYIFVYWIGILPQEVEDKIDDFAAKQSLQVIRVRLNDPKGAYSKEDNRQVGPSDFVNLLFHSSFVITDSFHGTAFSLIFHKNFINLPNADIKGDQRVKNLKDQFNLSPDHFVLESVPTLPDWEKIDQQIAQRQEEAIALFVPFFGQPLETQNLNK